MIIKTDIKEMMSDSLKDQISSEVLDDIRNKFIFCFLTFKVNERDENVASMLQSISEDKDEKGVFSLEIKTSFDDSFGIFESWKNLTVSSFEIILSENKISYVGPFHIKGLKLFNIDSEKMISSLMLQLEKSDI
jgi:hypothetical protein